MNFDSLLHVAWEGRLLRSTRLGLDVDYKTYKASFCCFCSHGIRRFFYRQESIYFSLAPIAPASHPNRFEQNLALYNPNVWYLSARRTFSWPLRLLPMR